MKDIQRVKTGEDQEEVARLMEKYDLVALPVVDELGRLVGRITIDDVVDIIKEEADKDYQLASGISEDIESTDSIWVLTRGRLPWLILGFTRRSYGGTCHWSLRGGAEALIRRWPFLFPWWRPWQETLECNRRPIVVQGLANNTLGLSSISEKLFKEFLVGLLNALVCSLLLFSYNVLVGSPLGLELYSEPGIDNSDSICRLVRNLCSNGSRQVQNRPCPGHRTVYYYHERHSRSVHLLRHRANNVRLR